MPVISSLGVGSGLDIESIISGIMQVEQLPLQRLQQDKAEIEAQISEFGKIKSALSTLDTAVEKLNDKSAFDAFLANSGDDDVFTATATSEASETNHSINVLSLAQSHRLASGVFASDEAQVGEGSLFISSGTNNFSIDITSDNDSLTGLRDAINTAEDNKSVRASVINVDGGSRLILTALNTGLANSIEISVTDDADGNDTDASGLSSLVYQAVGVQNLTEVDAAQDASLTVDGFAVQSDSNFVSDVIGGVTINLNQVGTAELTVERDIDHALSAMDGIVSAFNTLAGTLDEVRLQGALGSDSMLYGIQDQLRAVFSSVPSTFDTKINQSFTVGFDFSREGTLSFDAEDFKAQVSEDFTDLMNFFTDATHGLGARLTQVLDTYAQVGGVIDSRTDGLQSQSRTVDDRIEALNIRLESIEERYRQQFSAMDALVGNLNSTGTYLAQQLANLPGATFNSGS